ncbi:sodium-coupled monocarboxylate transporter 1-like [Zootoca vivipara]|uniref:sodium-coupled monocarboxylate transporter 1-like n=1 Tax=Zootoca vivipara TaxID=8524 RepID=UPI001591B498|nr:sodium-coupled monocarboxylate transporter 1-like [Zootoca vivipara]
MLVCSAVIGIFFATRGVHKTQDDYMMAGRKLTCIPVALSLTASFMSAVTVLGTPAEVYRFGIAFGLFAFAYVIMVLVSAEVFLPVYYRLHIVSTYEYLELRYNKKMRLLGTVMFMTLTILYTGIVIYSPSLALSQVTGFQLWGSVVSTGIVCTFYCTLGGLKAVIWTDVFQFMLMICGFLAVIFRTLVIKGGFAAVMNDARHGGRLRFWDFNPSPLQRHTVWTVIIGGSFTWLGIYGVNQSQVQRYLACKSRLHAKLSLYLNLLGLCVTLCSAVLSGLSMYSIYKDCDPWTSGFVGAPDQLIPYLVMEILGDFPGVPGLFVAGTYSGTLSTVSSSINALAAVTMEDLIKPHFKMSDSRMSRISIGMNLLFGTVCLAMAGLASKMGALLQAALSIFGIIGGPLLGIFAMGILLPFANPIGAFLGLICGFLVTLWVGLGSLIYPPSCEKTLPLHLSTAGCWKYNVTFTTPLTTTVDPTPPQRSFLHEYFYSLSYLYFSLIGTMVTFIVGAIVSAMAGGFQQTVESKLLFGKEDFIDNFVFWKSKWVQLYERLHPKVNPEEPVVSEGAVEDTA